MLTKACIKNKQSSEEANSPNIKTAKRNLVLLLDSSDEEDQVNMLVHQLHMK